MAESAQGLLPNQPCVPADAALRPSTMRVLATALIVAALGALVWVIASQRTRALDGTQVLGEWFEMRALPFGLEVVGAAIEPRGDEVVRLRQANAPEELPKNAVPEVKSGEPQPRVDWSKIASGPEGTPPVEVVVMRVPVAAAKAELEALFRSGQELRGDFKSIGAQGGKRILDRGKLTWGRFAADYAQEREFEPGLTFRDVLRVNLSREHAPCVMLARWPRNVPASKQRVEELLAAFVARD